jgi:hypothetical protein
MGTWMTEMVEGTSPLTWQSQNQTGHQQSVISYQPKIPNPDC